MFDYVPTTGRSSYGLLVTAIDAIPAQFIRQGGEMAEQKSVYVVVRGLSACGALYLVIEGIASTKTKAAELARKVTSANHREVSRHKMFGEMASADVQVLRFVVDDFSIRPRIEYREHNLVDTFWSE